MNKAVLAVAGSRKTQSIVDLCADPRSEPKKLVLTYTVTGQGELSHRLTSTCVPGRAPVVTGWYSFLLNYWVRPFLPLLFPNRRLQGFSFDGDPGRYAKGERRFLDDEGRAYKVHLSKLALDIATRSKGKVIERLQRIYRSIYIDEVQDLTGCDLHILSLLMKSTIDLYMVGDIRQSVYETNHRDQNLKQYKGVRMLDWFTGQASSGLLEIEHKNTTWRFNQRIADCSDLIFHPRFGFPSTVSVQSDYVDHCGVFAIAPSDVPAYVEAYDPLCLRDSRRTAEGYRLPFRNFGAVKGLTVDRVLIFPTRVVEGYLTVGGELKDKTACGLYVAVTRAKHSVAFVVDDPEKTTLATWRSC